jgi:hypothetical protein
MQIVTLIGINLGKPSFHLHAQDEFGHMVYRKKLTRQQMLTLLGNTKACMLEMEVCAGAH